MTAKTAHTIVTYLIAAVWLINGLCCKVLNMVPRHELIVARILGADHSRFLIVAIGCSEIVMAAWIISGRKALLNTWTQIIVIATMNTLEFLLAPDLLLWGHLNALFAFLLIVVIYANRYYLRPLIQPA